MIRITCPNDNIPERSYAIEALLVDILGCGQKDYVLSFSDEIRNYELITETRKVIVEDHFFIHHKQPLSYLRLENIPDESALFHGAGYELPIIYGEDHFIEEDSVTIVGLDLFASVFFMLSRWEESLLGREEKGDCDEANLFAVKHGFYNRPVVNEYAEFLQSLLPDDIKLPERQYQVVLSHDVDGFITPSWKRIAKDFVKQTLHGAPKNKVRNLTWQEEIKYKIAFPSEFDQFEFYTNLTDKYRIAEWFHFKVCGRGEKEATYLFNDERTKGIVGRLKDDPRHVMGFHPSQNVFGQGQQWEKEVSRIRGLLGADPTVGRNHHLLYNHTMMEFWEGISEACLDISNCVFHKRQGFRSGACVPYHVYNIFQRRAMNLMEHPGQIMDSVIRFDEKTKSRETRWEEIRCIVDQVRKHQGELVLTWHIYVRNAKLIKEYFQWCERTMRYAVKE